MYLPKFQTLKRWLENQAEMFWTKKIFLTYFHL
jgi:hypothetical protein